MFSNSMLVNTSAASGNNYNALQDFTTYTQVGTQIVATSSTVATGTSVSKTSICYLYKDFGAGFWTGTITSLFTAQGSLGSGSSCAIVMSSFSDIIGKPGTATSQNSLCVLMSANTSIQTIFMTEQVGTTLYNSSSYTSTPNTPYYCKLVRDPSVGTYGTAYLYIYSDSGRTNLLSTLSLTLHSPSPIAYQYYYAMSSYASAVNNQMSGTSKTATLTKV